MPTFTVPNKAITVPNKASYYFTRFIFVYIYNIKLDHMLVNGI